MKFVLSLTATFEEDFNGIFRHYWEHNRTITESLSSIAKTPDHPNLKLEDVPNCLAVSVLL